ncbi:MAG: hypothetical protein ACJ77N_17200 [Chloroflexota bacterium]
MGSEHKEQSAPHAGVDPGKSVGRSGEDVAHEDEAGRADTGSKGQTERPTGESTARDYTGIDPKEPITGGPREG